MNPDDEREAFWKAVHTVDDRVTRLEGRFDERADMTLDAIRGAVREAMPRATLTAEQHRWVEMAIEAEAQRITFRRAVIEKSAIGLVWAGIVALGIVIREYAIAHGMWRP